MSEPYTDLMERPSDDGARPSQGQDRRQDVPNPLARPAGDEPGWERVPVGVSEARRLAALPQGGAFLALRAEGADLFIPRVEGYNPEAPLPLPLALALTALVAEALEPVHDQGGAFGELSPSGILFDRHGVLRIRPAPRQAPLAEPQGGAITPATDSLGLGGLLRYWLGGGWPSQTLKATPEAGALSPLGVKVVLEGLSRSLPKLRLQPACSARQAIYALLRRASLEGDQLLRDMLRARGLGVALRAWSEPVRLTARAAPVPELPRVTPTGLFAASQLLNLSPPIPAPPLFPAAPARDPRPRSQTLLRESPAPRRSRGVDLPEVEGAETEELPDLPRFARPAARESVAVPEGPAGRMDRGEDVSLELPKQPERAGHASPGRSVQPERAGDASPERSVQAERGGDASPERSVQPERGGDASPERSVQPERGGDASPGRSVQPERTEDASPERSVQAERGGDVSPERSVQAERGGDVSPGRSVQPERAVDTSSTLTKPAERAAPAPPAPPPTGVVPPLPAPPPRQPVSLLSAHTSPPRPAAPPAAPPTDFDDDEPTPSGVPSGLSAPRPAPPQPLRPTVIVHPHVADTPPTELPTAAHEALMHRPGAVVDLAQLGGLGVQGDPSRMAEKGPGKWTEQGRSTDELSAIIKNPNPVRSLDLESPRGGAWAWLVVVLIVLGLGALAWWLLQP